MSMARVMTASPASLHEDDRLLQVKSNLAAWLSHTLDYPGRDGTETRGRFSCDITFVVFIPLACGRAGRVPLRTARDRRRHSDVPCSALYAAPFGLEPIGVKAITGLTMAQGFSLPLQPHSSIRGRSL